MDVYSVPVLSDVQLLKLVLLMLLSMLGRLTGNDGKFISEVCSHLRVKSIAPIKAPGCAFLSELGRKLFTQSGDDRETSFFFQRLSVLIQRFNTILLLDSFVKEEE